MFSTSVQWGCAFIGALMCLGVSRGLDFPGGMVAAAAPLMLLAAALLFHRPLGRHPHLQELVLWGNASLGALILAAVLVYQAECALG
ncbi:hypothetical protein [Paraburkholderia sp. GAS448]|uniref:hypothetical protein n=1 Tax=Paraburkholderia sp. GAS448 TaxID=3035136 RepID=UPI003D1EE245